jgi:hypothetical protein
MRTPEEEAMTIDPFIDHPEPGPGTDGHDDILNPPADLALEHWFHNPLVAAEINEAARAHIYLQEMEQRARTAEQDREAADRRVASMLTKHDPGGRRTLGFALGGIVIVLLVVLDAIPLNWAAQAFDLDTKGTWLVTLILVVASVGAMLGFELTRDHSRRRSLLAVAVIAGYLALLGLRMEYLATVASESFLVALLQAAMLTAISAGLVICGSAILARTRSLSLSRLRAAAHRARQAEAEARTAHSQAAQKLNRHVGALRQLLLPRAPSSSTPIGVDHVQWAAAVERAIRRLFPAS